MGSETLIPGTVESAAPSYIPRFLEGQSAVAIQHVACGDLFTACLTGKGLGIVLSYLPSYMYIPIVGSAFTTQAHSYPFTIYFTGKEGQGDLIELLPSLCSIIPQGQLAGTI